MLIFLAMAEIALARAGGGGSSSGGGGGGGSHSSGGSGSGSGSGGLVIFILIMIVVVAMALYNAHLRKKKIEAAQKAIDEAELKDSAWNEDALKKRIGEVFLRFQNDWSSFNVDSMKEYLTDKYYKRNVLHMNVLKNLGRQNLMNEPKIARLEFMEVVDSDKNSRDRVKVEIKASAKDVLMDTAVNQALYTDNATFVEYWTFVRVGDDWKLDLIEQQTVNNNFLEKGVVDFAKRNNFFYDPDFGWLMMPNKGAIFNKTNFKSSDINNHVVGYFREKIVEFYTYIPYTNTKNPTNYIVAQAILPIRYDDILLKKKKFWNSDPKGLNRIETESNDFNKKFCLWAAPNDSASSFELLTPNFMEKIYELPFELNIEVVGNVLYFYAESRSNINYDKMLEILSWAFDEMKM